MKYAILTILTISILLLAACEQSLLGEQDEELEMLDELETMLEEGELELEQPGEDVQIEPSRFIITKTEGDLVLLAPEAIDPDGDAVSYAFTAPFDSQGRWQTSYGDAGEYTVTVTATDTKGASTTEGILVIIEHANRAPYLNCPDRIVVKEGDTVELGCEANDEEMESIVLTYFGWMIDESYTTSYEDAGEHEVTVKAMDEAGLTAEERVQVIVQNVNRAPVFPIDFPNELIGDEGDVFAIDTSEIYDPDGDAVTVTFSTPFGDDGVWASDLGESGEYPVDVVASDGSLSTKRRVTVSVGMLNTAPVLQRIPDVTVFEGETVRIDVSATDREDDELITTISGWMTSTTYTTTYDDAGTYTVKVTVSDGQHADSQVVHVTVIDRNRPPVFVVPA